MTPASFNRLPWAARQTKQQGWTAPQICIALIALGWVGVALLYAMSIGGVWDPISLSTWGWLAFWLVALSAGYLIGVRGHAKLRHSRTTSVPPRLNLWVMTLCIVTATGVGLFIFDFAILRGYGFATAAAAIRTEEVNAAMQGMGRSSAFSGLGRLLIPAFMPTTVLMVLFWKFITPATRWVYFVTAFFTVLEQLLFEGGRFFIAATAVSVVTAYLLFPKVGGPRSAPKKKIPYGRLALLSVVMLYFFAYVFIQRVLERGDYFATAYLQLARSFKLTPHYSQIGWFEGPFGAVWYTICMLWLYATQGINELDLLLQQPYLEHAYGLYQLPHIGQAVMALTGIDIRYDVRANLPTYGSYATFYGHSYVDFGNAGSVAFALLLGYLTGRGIAQFWRGRMGVLSLGAPVLFTLCIFSPVISLIPTIWPGFAWSLVAGALLRFRAVER